MMEINCEVSLIHSLTIALKKAKYSKSKNNVASTLTTAPFLPQEREEGNHEYKYTLANIAQQTLTHRVSQLRWRLQESMALGHQLDCQWQSACLSTLTNDENRESNVQVKSTIAEDKVKNLSSYSDNTEQVLSARAYYHIGVDDDGTPRGLTLNDMQASLQTLQTMATLADCRVNLQKVQNGLQGLVAEVLFCRSLPECVSAVTTHVWFEGDAHVGKSTLISVLQLPTTTTTTTHESISIDSSVLDNGCGSARLRVCSHQHELIAGHTSSITSYELFFDSKGELLSASSAEYAVEKDVESENKLPLSAHKILSLIDTPGHHKYVKTAIAGFSTRKPQIVLRCIDAVSWNKGEGLNKINMNTISMHSDIPTVLIVTKCDLLSTNVNAQTNIEKCVNTTLLSTVDDVDVFIRDPVMCSTMTPVIVLSSVTGHGLAVLRKLLFHIDTLLMHYNAQRRTQTTTMESNEITVRIWRSLPLTNNSCDGSSEDEDLTACSSLICSDDDDQKKKQKRLSHMSINWLCDQHIFVGFVERGVLRLNEKLLLGPSLLGEWFTVTVTSIRVHNVAVQYATAGQVMTCCVETQSRDELFNSSLARSCIGTVLLTTTLCTTIATNNNKSCSWMFDIILHSNDNMMLDSQLRIKQQLVAHCGSIRQSVELIATIAVSDSVVKWTLRFLHYPEFIIHGEKIILRDDRVRAIGWCA